MDDLPHLPIKLMFFWLAQCQITRWQPLNKSWLLNLTIREVNHSTSHQRCVLACGQKVRDVFDFIVEQSLGAHCFCWCPEYRNGWKQMKTCESMTYPVVLWVWTKYFTYFIHVGFLSNGHLTLVAVDRCDLMQTEKDLIQETPIRNATWFNDEPIRAINRISNHSAIQNISSIHDFILSLIHLNTQFISIPSLSSVGHHPPTPKKGSHFVVGIRQRLVRSGFFFGWNH